MPRPRKIVMEGISAQEAHDSAIARSIKLYSPYEVVAGELCGVDPDLYGIVYRAPRGGDRKVVATRSKRANATKLRDQLNEAWAEGFWSSGKDFNG